MVVIIIIVVAFLCVGLFFYKPSLKTIIILSIITIAVIIWFLKGLGIEDYYGRNHHIYFDGKENYIVIMEDKNTNKFIVEGQIQRKTWNRIFIKTEKDTLDLNDWIEQKAGYMVEVNCELKKH